MENKRKAEKKDISNIMFWTRTLDLSPWFSSASLNAGKRKKRIKGREESGDEKIGTRKNEAIIATAKLFTN